MKNKKMLIYGAVALVAVAVWYFWLRKPKVAASGTAAEDQPTPVTNTVISAGGKRLIVPSYN